MFIRKKTKKDPKTKKEYYTYQLVESIRTEKGPRQQILLSIGNNINLTETDRKTLGNRIKQIIEGYHRTLFTYPKHIETLAQSFAKQLIAKRSQNTSRTPKQDKDYHTVDLNTLTHSDCRTIGLEHITLETIRKLKLDTKLKKLGLTSREVEVAIGTIVGRLVHPSSERSTHFWLRNNTALGELIGSNYNKLSLNQLYNISDKLLKHKDTLEEHLASIEENLFSLDNTVVLFDLTNTYLEGSGAHCKKAQRGRSKEKRFDRPLVCLGMILNQEGFPRKSKIYDGNTSEPSTLQNIIKDLSKSETGPPSVIILDAGISSEENLKWLREQKRPYIVCARNQSEPPVDLKEHYHFLREKKDHTVKAKLLEKDNDTGESKLFCHSTAREEKETSIKMLFQKRFEQELDKLKKGLTKKGCTKNYEKVIEKIGRLKQKYSRVARFYSIQVTQTEKGKNAADISYTCNAESADNQYGGYYCLRCWGLDWKAERLWKTYIMLTKIEDGFRALKSDLGMRPIFHRSEDRIDGHLFITLLAYHIQHSILYQLSCCQMNIRWQTLKQIMATQTQVTSTFKNDKNQTIHVRSSTVAEPLQKEIYNILQISDHPGFRKKSIV